MESGVIFFSVYSPDFIGDASDSGDICKCSAKDNSFLKSYFSNSKISNCIFHWKTVLRGLSSKRNFFLITGVGLQRLLWS